MNNLNISLILFNIAQLLTIKGANQYKINAYTQASKKIKHLPKDIETIAEKEGLTSLEGVGTGLADKITEILTTGSCDYYEQLTTEYPSSLIPLLNLRGIGASKVRKFYEELGITTLEELKEKMEQGELTKLSGIGKKTEEKIAVGITKAEQVLGKISLAEGQRWANSFCEYLLASKTVNQVRLAGELRRRKELIAELIFIVNCRDVPTLKQIITDLPIVSEIKKTPSPQITAQTELGIKLVFSLPSTSEFAKNLFWLTGTEEFNQAIKANYPTFGLVEQEEEIFTELDLPYIIPELRRTKESIKAAQEENLPDSITRADIKGDLHIHSNWSDGQVSIAEIAKACQSRGYKYLAITDHTQALTVANGLSYDELKKQKQKINQLNKELEVKILAGAEVDILTEALDYSLSTLEELDIVIASIHSGFNDSKAEIMKRISLALENPQVDILGHPTGKLLVTREGYPIDFDQMVEKAVTTETILEINASPKRFDLDSSRVKQAQQAGAEFVINTDAHRLSELPNMFYGTAIARRGWLEAEDVLNTCSKIELENKLVN